MHILVINLHRSERQNEWMRTCDGIEVTYNLNGVSQDSRPTFTSFSSPQILSTMSAPQKSKAKEPEVIDTTGDPENSDNPSDSEGEDQEDHKVASTPSTSTSQKKKKKKKSKAKKLLNAIRGNEEIPQEVVDQVLDKVKTEGGPGSSEANAENVRLALEEMKIMDVVKGKAGIGGLNKKDLGEHKVCHYSHQLKRVKSIALPSFGAPNPFHN